MCLKNVDFALEYDTRGKFYYGVGYKNLQKVMTDHNGNEVETLQYYSKWRNSAHKYQSLVNAEKYGNDSIRADSGTYYPAGFHVFLEERHARQYSYHVVYKVMFRDVIAFGNNEYSYPYAGPCVIAKKMKIIGKV